MATIPTNLTPEQQANAQASNVYGNDIPAGAPNDPRVTDPIRAAKLQQQLAESTATTNTLNSSSGGVVSPYYSRYTGPEQAAKDALATYTPPQTEEDLTAKGQKNAQAEIDNLGKYYDSLLADQSIINQGRDRGTNAVSVLNGLSGSSDAEAAATRTTVLNEGDNKKIQAERGAAIGAILSKIRSDAVTQARQSRLDSRQSADDVLAQRTKNQTEALTSVVNLAGSGVTANGLKSTDPTSYQHLLNQVGSESELNALFIKNLPKDQIHDTKVEGGKYIVSYQNPLTGKISIQTLDLGIPANYSKSVDLGDKLMFIPDNFNPSKDKPYYVTKGVAPKASTETKPTITFSVSQKGSLVSAGAKGTDIDNLQNDLNTSGLDAVLANPTLDPRIKAILPSLMKTSSSSGVLDFGS